MHAGSSKSLAGPASASLRPRLRAISSRQYPSFPSCQNPLPTLLDRNYIDNHKVAVVCSARSGSTKALGTTNLLLKASSEALQRPAAGTSRTPCNQDWTSPLHSPGGSSGSRSPSRSAPPSGGLSSSLMMSSSLTMSSMPPPKENYEPPFFATVDLIRLEHVIAARSSINSTKILRDLEDEIEKDCDALRSFLMAVQVGIRSHLRNSVIQTLPRSSVRCLQDPKTQ